MKNYLKDFEGLRPKTIMFSKNLTFKSKMILLSRKLKNFILDIDVFNLTGLFVFFILMFYMVWYKALVIGIFGYLVYLKVEDSFLKIFGRKNK